MFGSPERDCVNVFLQLSPQGKYIGVKCTGPLQPIHLPWYVAFHISGHLPLARRRSSCAEATSASQLGARLQAPAPPSHSPSLAWTVQCNLAQGSNSWAHRCCSGHSKPSPLVWSRGAVVHFVASEDIAKGDMGVTHKTSKKWCCYPNWRWGVPRNLNFQRTNACV